VGGGGHRREVHGGLSVLEGGADIVLLDNMTLEEMRQAVTLIGGRALTEASGGITLERVGEIARTGVDLISVGALTHSVQALDIGLDVAVHDVVRRQPVASGMRR